MTEENHDDEDVVGNAGTEGDAVRGSSIFDLFEPPPDIDPNRFGPIPIVDGEPAEESEIDADDEDDFEEEFVDREALTRALEDDADDVPVGLAPEADEFASIYELLPEEPASTPSGGGSGSLPNWTEPPTGRVPSVVDRGDGDDGWAEVGGPTWKGEGPDNGAAEDLAGVFGPAAIASHNVSGGISIDDDAVDDLPPGAGSPQRAGVAAAPGRTQRPPTQIADVADDLGERNIPQAILVGAIFGGLALVAFSLGNAATLILILAIALLGAVELYNAMRLAGLHPATLLGITATVALPLSVYHRGEAGFVLVLGLTVVFGALWYIVGADTHRPALNLGLTFFGVLWVGVLASFAALLLLDSDGPSFILAAIIATALFDTLAFAGGKALGRTPFHHASPNKTWEGTLIGVLGAMAGGMIVVLLEISALADDWKQGVYLGLVVGVLAPLGDLTESIVKRDLGVKDMGTLLPGHGGILDRVDGILFVLPGVYYLARLLDLIG